MAIDVINGFHVGATAPIDDRFLLSKAQMLAFNDNIAPQSFLCCCTDDNKVYQYTKTNTADATTGKFRVFEGGGSDKVVFFNIPAREDWEDESIVRPFYNQLKSAIDNGKFIIVVEKLSGGFDCWVYYTVSYNSVDSSEEDQEWIDLISFDGIYVDTLEVFPTSITANESEIKGDVEIEFDKSDISSVADELFDAVANGLNPVLLEDIGHADYHWKFINSEYDESIGAITGYVFLCSKNGELHKLTIYNNTYKEVIISNQASTMPVADAKILGKIIQYVGTTDSSYTNGYFYKCTESSGTYTWQNINVQSPEKELNNSPSSLKFTEFNDLGTISDDITLTFAETTIDKYVEYNGRFTTDATHSVTFPVGVTMKGDTTQEANATYEFSIDSYNIGFIIKVS